MDKKRGVWLNFSVVVEEMAKYMILRVLCPILNARKMLVCGRKYEGSVLKSSNIKIYSLLHC